MSTPAAPRPTRPGRPVTRGLKVGSLHGTPIILTPGWAVIAIVLVVIFTPIVQRRFWFGSIVEAGAIALVVPILLAASVLAHEVAHARAARARGYGVDEIVISLWGGHTSFGRDIDRPGDSAVVAVVGPLANGVIALGGWAVIAYAQLPDVADFLLYTVAWTNGVVAVFNLIPALPLDGGRLLEALIWRLTGDRNRGMLIAGRCGQAMAVVVAVGVLGAPLLAGRRADLTTAIWGVLIAAVIWQGATGSVRAAKARARARGFDAREFSRPAQVLAGGATVADVGGLPALVVDAQQRPVGVVDGAALSAVPQDLRADTPVTAILDASVPIALMTTPSGPGALAQLAEIVQAHARGVTVVLVADGAPMLLDVTAVLHHLNSAR